MEAMNSDIPVVELTREFNPGQVSGPGSWISEHDALEGRAKILSDR